MFVITHNGLQDRNHISVLRDMARFVRNSRPRAVEADYQTTGRIRLPAGVWAPISRCDTVMVIQQWLYTVTWN